jgi:LmbE family N-acetylglucosaminyl deacetylase
MARYAAEGVRVVLVCATRGEEGEVLNPRMEQPGILERMPEIREAELTRLAEHRIQVPCSTDPLLTPISTVVPPRETSRLVGARARIRP